MSRVGSKQKDEKGFTLVELLIVIVIIAILAAVTLVTYNGIVQRAYNSAVISGVATYKRALAAYVAANGQYPPFYGSSCLGVGYPNQTCGGSDGPARENSDFNTALGTLLSSMPPVGTKVLQTGTNTTFVGADIINWDQFKVNGIENQFYIMYVLEGSSQDCGDPSVVDIDGSWPNMKYPASQPYSWNADTSTMCVVPLPNLS